MRARPQEGDCPIRQYDIFLDQTIVSAISLTHTCNHNMWFLAPASSKCETQYTIRARFSRKVTVNFKGDEYVEKFFIAESIVIMAHGADQVDTTDRLLLYWIKFQFPQH